MPTKPNRSVDFKGYKVDASGRIRSETAFPRSDLKGNLAALPSGWQLVEGSGWNSDTQWVQNGSVIERPTLSIPGVIKIRTGSQIPDLNLPTGTTVVGLPTRKMVASLQEINWPKPGTFSFEIESPWPYQVMIIVVEVDGLPIVSSSDIKAEATRRLSELDWRVERATDRQDDVEEAQLRQLREAIRNASNVLEKNPPLDYLDPKHWPQP